MIRKAAACFAFVAVFGANAQEYKPADSGYMLYSGSLGDPAPPTKSNAKLSLAIKGKAATDLFNQIGPDTKDSCQSEKGSRFRTKGNGSVSCQYTKQDGYSCYLGVDLKKGKLVNASVC